MHAILNRPGRVLQITAALFPLIAFAASARADIFQWEYINPADPGQGKQQSTTLARSGAGVDAVPGADLSYRDLTMAYLIGADLTGAFGRSAYLTNADLSQANLANAYFLTATFTGAILNQANLTNAGFQLATLTDVDFTDAEVRGARFGRTLLSFGIFGTGLTLAQLYSTASCQAKDLSGIGLDGNDLAGGNFAGQNLINANFIGATLTEADFTSAEVRGASFGKYYACVRLPCDVTGTGLTLAQLYSTASYQAHDLRGINLSDIDLSGVNFAGFNLTNVTFNATLTDADFTGAEARGASLRGITLAQLYSTASYQAHDLTGIQLWRNDNDLTDGNFVGQNLTNANFVDAVLTGADFRRANLTNADFYGATLTGADLSAADARGARFLNLPASATTTNLIRPDGHIDGVDLSGGGLLVVRDDDVGSVYDPSAPPIPITVDQHLAMGPGGTLRMVFEADAWDSTISFLPGIPVTLGGTLELTFAADVNLATQIGRTFDLFDWTGVHPTGAFAVSSPYAWDLSNLYATGEVTLMSVPEPSALLLLSFGLVALLSMGRIALRNRALQIAAALFPLVGLAVSAQADIFQWEYINPADPSLGKRPSTTLAHDGAGVDAVPGALLGSRNLTMAYLIGADLTNAHGYAVKLTDADLSHSNLTNADLLEFDLTRASLSQANLTNAYVGFVKLTDADFTGTIIQGANFSKSAATGGITLTQLYSTASYQARDLSGVRLTSNDLADGNFAGQNLANADFGGATLTRADFTGANLTNTYFGGARLTATDFTNAYVQWAHFGNTTAGGLTAAQLYSTASYESRDLTGIRLDFDDLSGWEFAGQNLTNAYFSYAALTDADFTGAEVRGASFERDYFGGTGISPAQLYSTASYQAHNLSGIDFSDNNLGGGNFADQNLTNARFYGATLTGAHFRQANLTDAAFGSANLTGAEFREANLTNANFYAATLTGADFTDAEVRGTGFDADYGGTGITLAQLYSTASCQAKDLSGIGLDGNDLAGGNFAGQNLTNANFANAMLTDADFTDADVRGASFDRQSFGGILTGTGITLAQLYSTASYSAEDLSGIRLNWHNLAAGDFRRQNLKNAHFGAANLTNANFRETNLANAEFTSVICSLIDGCGNITRIVDATLTGADFTSADTRGAHLSVASLSGATSTNLIRRDGHISGLDLNAGGRLVVRDYDADSRYEPALPPIPITVDQHLAMGPGGTLRMVFEADAWDSTISFLPGIPVTLGGTLELTFAADVNLATQIGRTLDLFDWTGVHPTGNFAISSPYAWNLSNLYTTGEVTLSAIPEPASIALAAAGAFGLIFYRRRKRP